MNAIILSIGDELVLGQTVDTNSAWISQQLAAVGVGVVSHLTIPDDQRATENAIRETAGRCDALIISGGLGPTEDDLTRQALAAVMGTELEENAVWMAELHKFFEARGRVMPPINRIQAMIPRGAEMIFNTCGTAAGIAAVLPGMGKDPEAQERGDARTWRNDAETRRSRDAGTEQLKNVKTTPNDPIATMETDSAESQWDASNAQSSSIPAPPGLHVSTSSLQAPGCSFKTPGPSSSVCRVFALPGVPREMKAMFTRDVLPCVRQATGGAVILSRTLHTFGLGESAIAEMLGDLMRRGRNPSVGTTVTAGVVSLRVNARFPSLPTAQTELAATVFACQHKLGDLIFGQDEETLPGVLSRMLGQNRDGQQFTVAAAESCTGGLIAKMLTDIPGSSTYFRFGWVTYSNQAKQTQLGVSASVLAERGAVSEPVVLAMAEGARQRAGATFALAVSGVAGPDGGTPEKPVGTVWIALSHPTGSLARQFLFSGDREMVRDRSAKMALAMLRFHLLGKTPPF